METTLSRQEILDLSRDTTLYEWTAQKVMKPLVIDHAKGIYMWDADGKRYMDFNSQLMCVNIGHGDTRVIEAVKAQMEKVCYIAPTVATTAPRAELGRMLNEITPGNLSKAFFTNGGAEANENAIKIARMYSGRHKILVRYRAYHGATAGAITLTGDPRRWAAEPGIPGVVRIPDFYPYRAGKELDDAEYTASVLNATEDIIQFEGPHTIAAMIIETVVGTNGILIPSAGYIRGLRELCNKYGILLIADEVMSGFGRTGEWFAVDHWGVVPDMMTLAKGLTSAYVPLGATMVTDTIAEYFDDHPLYAGLTYNAHSVGCAAGVACINIYKEDKLIENARAMGEILKVELANLKAKHPSIGDTRAIGLFSLVELVKNRDTREPLTPYNPKPSELGPMPAFNAFLRENGLFTFVRWNTFFINPPLCITEHELREGLAIIDRGLDIVDQAVA
ncbi:MAG: aminotransferase class III-fold pyridoxal phosphate-dependent enzyme [Chloroflexi bacterium SZAS-1]|jgi:taurine--2-oxoglutarate transaminase|nr:aminotransferase class III-fold pyridoxal phosphate-dependent enzyme [Chloroflexi bacterium SZAS-1]